MSTEREYLDYLYDLLDSIKKIEQFIQGLDFSTFKNDDKTLYAVIRAIEILGEATKNIPSHIKNDYTNVPWREMAGMRDKLIHEYFGVNKEIVWKTARQEVPALKPLIEQIMSDMKS